MKKILSFLVLLSFLAACTNQTPTVSKTVDQNPLTATDSVDNSNLPAFKFEKEVFDFGEIKEGEKVSYDFKFKNIGNAPLIISSATATCGCTIPEYPSEPLAPGAEGVIRVVFNSSGKPGMQNKIVSITANTNPTLTELNILGNVLSKE
ncbi:DUF1573 domain-containing protein [Daejeonella sp.]|jgi:hypothetical protein|uniref:DUF1573 domain-containing protein n=1 Tax=Daejeonella sp. TaxID=2805397 RepID=UPI0037848B64